MKKLYLAVITIVLFSAATLNIWANSENKNIKHTINDYLNEKVDSIINRNVDNLDKYYSEGDDAAKKYLLFTKQQILQDYLIAYSASNYSIKKIYPKIKIKKIDINDNSASAEAVLTTFIHWNAANAFGDPFIGTNIEKHLIELTKKNNQWTIKVDKYLVNGISSEESLKENPDNLSDMVNNLRTQAQAALIRSKNSPPSRLEPVPRSYRSENFPRTSYNRDGAYNWAHKYWKSYSTEFVNLGDQEGEGGDCTNFVSQCLRAGGAENATRGTYKWYYINNGTSKTSHHSYSWTWTTARGLNSVLTGNYNKKEFGPKGSEKIITGDTSYTSDIGQYIAVGDLIQYEWSPGSKIKHSAIIVGMFYNSAVQRYEPVISTHSFDSWNLPWTKNAYKTHFIHITGVN